MCPICKCVNTSFIGIPKVTSKAAKIIRHEYRIVMCNKCMIYYVDPCIDLTLDEWKYLYDENYFPQMSTWYEKNREKERIERFNNLENFVSKGEKKFLDVGCGEGHCLIEAVRRGWKVYGIDITDNRIERARNEAIKFFHLDLVDCQFQENFFDIIYLDSVLEHVINTLEYLLEIKRILKKGGVLYIGIPYEDSLLNDIKKSIYLFKASKLSPKLKPFEAPYHVVGFNKRAIQFALEMVQLDIKRIRNFACRLEFLKAKPFSKTFFHSLLLLPIYLLAVPFKKEVYLEVYAQNK